MQTVSLWDVIQYYIFPGSFLRLLEILDNDFDHGRSEPFRTYEALDQASRDQADNLQVTRDALGGAHREQNYTAARLYGDCEALHRSMYTELQQLVLGPQVRPTVSTDQDLLCPNAQVGLFPFPLCTVMSSPQCESVDFKLSITVGEGSW